MGKDSGHNATQKWILAFYHYPLFNMCKDHGKVGIYFIEALRINQQL